MQTTITFWGVRGSIPAPITSDAIGDKIRTALERFESLRATRKGNVESLVSKILQE